MTYRPHRSIWNHIGDPEAVGNREDGDTCFNDATGEGWVWNESYSKWNEFRLSGTAGIGTAGYTMAGWDGSSYATRCQKLQFSNEATSVITSASPVSSNPGKCVSSPWAGYQATGYNGVYTTDFRKLLFSDESYSALTSTMSDARFCVTACNSLIKGYMCNGNIVTTAQTSIDALTFQNDSVHRLTTTLIQTRVFASGVESKSNGYLIFGKVTTVGAGLTNFTKLVFQTESNSTLAAGVSPLRRDAHAFSSPVVGYVCGGENTTVSGSSLSTIVKLTFATDTMSSMATTMTGTRKLSTGVYSRVKGYTVSGRISEGPVVDTTSIDSLLFSDETSSTVASGLANLFVNSADRGVQSLYQ